MIHPAPCPSGATLVLDIGKTNVKLVLVDAAGALLAERRIPNTVRHDRPYPHHDTERIWTWMLGAMRELNTLAGIAAIVPVTHGATAALVDAHGLVLPVLDYESILPQALADDYAAARPAFSATLSPNLPAGLNLGRQLTWLQRSYPAEFARARHILLYPQYWAWRLSGVACSELTSLGCHTDLWEPMAGTWSELVTARRWERLLPPMQPAWHALGTLLPALQDATGIAPGCRVIAGIHDSNASLLRHLRADAGAVLSSGTWLIAAALRTGLASLREEADMLANVSATGQPVACMRFMGGREFSHLAGPDPTPCSLADLDRLIARGTLALPSFADAGGPFAGRAGRIEGPAPQSRQERYALATLYVALMSDYCLDALGVTGATGDLVVEGSFTANPYFAPLLAAWRPGQGVRVSNDASGTTHGAWMLAHWGQTSDSAAATIAPAALAGLATYRNAWRGRLVPDSIPDRASAL